MGALLAAARMRQVLILASLVFAALPAGSALADTTVGQTGAPVARIGLAGFLELVQPDVAMPVAGVVTSLQTQSSTCDDRFAGIYDLQVLRPLGGDQYQVLGDTGDQTDPCDSNLHSYSVDIPVAAGDVIGVYIVMYWQGLLSPGGGLQYAQIPEPAVGDTVTMTAQDTGTLDESATLVPSASGLAQKVVDDTSSLKPGTALTDKATAINAAVTTIPQQTAAACADITEFLGLVKAQTGKKLTTGPNGTATLLTTDANNLAATLGCA